MQKFYGGEVPPAITVNPETTFETAVAKILENGIHRVWICDKKAEQPIGVFSLSDVIAQFTTYEWAHTKKVDGMFA